MRSAIRWHGRVLAALGLALVASTAAEAQQVVIARPTANRGLGFRATQPADPTNTAPTRGLGTFYQNPMGMVGGSFPLTAGYGPLDNQVNATLTQYGPLSAFRAQTVRVPVYTRGYDGSIRVEQGRSFSYPMAPELSPFADPTPASYRPGFRGLNVPAWRSNAINWIDQN